MNMRTSLTIQETRILVYARDGGCCFVCGRKVAADYPWHLAHIVPQDVPNMANYGAELIHHPDNMVLTCCQTCNDMVSRSNQPEFEKRHMERIRAKVEESKL